MSLVERVADLNGDAIQVRKRQRAARQAVGESFAFHVLHHQVRGAVTAANVVERADVGVVEGGDGAGFALESLQNVGTAGEILSEDLDGDGAVEARIAAAIHFPHTSSPGGGQDFIGTESRAGRKHIGDSLTLYVF